MEQELLLFFEYNYGEFFERTKADVLNAEYQLNMRLQLYKRVTLNDFYECLGLPVTEFGDDIGWYLDTDIRPNAWIKFDWEYVELEDGMECHIINLPQLSL